MNIKFCDNELFLELKKQSFARFQFGSFLHGTMNKDSDIDYIYLYKKNECFNDLIEIDRCLHYKDPNDHLFFEISDFVDKLKNGGSNVLFELIHHYKIKEDNNLNFLYKNKEKFYNYNNIKAYLGMARRDIKEYKKTNINKKIYHAFRSTIFAENLYLNNFNIDISSNDKLFNKLESIKDSGLDRNEVDKLSNRVSRLRKIINQDLNNQSIIQGVNKSFEEELTDFVNNLPVCQLNLRPELNDLFIKKYYS